MSGDTLHTDKPSSTINIKNAVPLVLDLDRMNYDIWRELFETHCTGFGVAAHLQPPDPKAAETSEWTRVDSIVKSWIYSTLSQSLLHMVLKKKSTAHGLWDTLEKLFRDNKENKAIQLENELRNITMGDSSVSEYCTRIKTIADLLDNLDAPVPERNLVAYTLSGLSKKFHYIATTIRHQKPLPSFMDARSMLVMEEQQMNHDQQKQANNMTHPVHSDHASSPTVLATDTNVQHNNSRGNIRGGRNGGRNSRGGRGGRTGGGRFGSSGGGHQRQQQLPMGWGFGWYPLASSQHPQQGLLPTPLPQTQVQSGGPRAPPGAVQQQQLSPFNPPVVPGPFPQTFFSPQQPQQAWSTQSATDQATSLPQAFNTMSLNDPGNDGWFMDTGATSHLHANAGFEDQTNSHAM